MQGSILNQRFELDRPIRQGRSGTAYLATDAATGELLVVKVFASGPPFDSELGIRFRMALERLRGFEHPHVEVPRDVGIADGCGYQASSYVAADPLDAVLRDGPLALREGLTLLSQVARGLDALHRAGFVHGGLLPRRVVVSRAGPLRAVLLSPGRHLLLRDSIQAYPDAAYVAPEQAPWLSLAPDRRADLYALGVLACRILLGVEPFPSHGDRDLARLHWQGAAAHALASAAALPRGLRQDLQRLLSVEPEGRPFSAEQVVADLAPFLDVEAAPASQAAPAFLSRAVPEGTAAVRDAVAAALGKAASGSGTLLAAHGWEGLGGEALLSAAIPAVEASGAVLLHGGVEPDPQSAPLSLARRWIADLANQWTRLPDARIGAARLGLVGAVERLGAPLADLIPEFADFGGAVPREPPAEVWSPARLARLRASAIARCCEILLAVADPARPLVLWIHDAAGLDPDSAELVRMLTHRLVAAPAVLLIGKQGPGSHPAPTDAADIVRQAHAPTAWLALAPLTAEATERQVAWLLYADTSDRAAAQRLVRTVAQRLYAAWVGIPWLHEQALRLLIEEGVLRRDRKDGAGGSGRWELREDHTAWTMPKSAQELIVRRLDALPDRDRLVLEAASVLGNPFAVEAVARLLEGFPPDVLIAALDAGVDGGWLVRGASGYRFAEPKARGWIHAALSEQRRHPFHQAMGALAESGALEPVEAWTAGWHLACEGDPAPLDRALLRLASTAAWPVAIGTAVLRAERQGHSLPGQASEASYSTDESGSRDALAIRYGLAALTLGKTQLAAAALGSVTAGSPEFAAAMLLQAWAGPAGEGSVDVAGLAGEALRCAGTFLRRPGLGTMLARVTSDFARRFSPEGGGAAPAMPTPEQNFQFALIESAAELLHDKDPSLSESLDRHLAGAAGMVAARDVQARALIRLGTLEADPQGPRFREAHRLVSRDKGQIELPEYLLRRGLAALEHLELRYAAEWLERAASGFADACDPAGAVEGCLGLWELARLTGPYALLMRRAADLVRSADALGSGEWALLGRGAVRYAQALRESGAEAPRAIADLAVCAEQALRTGSARAALRLAVWGLDLSLQSRTAPLAESIVACEARLAEAPGAQRFLAALAEWHLDADIDTDPDDPSLAQRAADLMARVRAAPHISAGLSLRLRVIEAIAEFRNGRARSGMDRLEPAIGLAERQEAWLLAGHLSWRAAEGMRRLDHPEWMPWAGKALVRYDELGVAWLTSRARAWVQAADVPPGVHGDTAEDAAEQASSPGTAPSTVVEDDVAGIWRTLDRIVQGGPLAPKELYDAALACLRGTFGAERAALFMAETDGAPQTVQVLPRSAGSSWINLWLVQAVFDEGRARYVHEPPAASDESVASGSTDSLLAIPISGPEGRRAVAVLARGAAHEPFAVADAARAAEAGRRAGVLFLVNASLQPKPAAVPQANAPSTRPQPGIGGSVRSYAEVSRVESASGLLSGRIRGLHHGARGEWGTILSAYYAKLEFHLSLHDAILIRRSDTEWQAVCSAGATSAFLAAQTLRSAFGPAGALGGPADLDGLRTGIGLNVGTVLHGAGGGGSAGLAIPQAAPMNRAERLADLSAFLRGGPLLAGDMAANLPGPERTHALRPLGRWRMAHGEPPHELYEALWLPSPAAREASRLAMSLWTKALDAYRREDWATAALGCSAYLSRMPGDRAARLMLRRCRRRERLPEEAERRQSG